MFITYYAIVVDSKVLYKAFNKLKSLFYHYNEQTRSRDWVWHNYDSMKTHEYS